MTDPRDMRAPTGFHEDRSLDRDDLSDDPIALFHAVARRRRGRRCPLAERDGRRHRRRAGPAVGSPRPVARRRRARVRLLHELREPQGPPAHREPVGGAGVPVEGTRPPGAREGSGRTGRSHRIRRLLRHPTSRRATGCVGLAPERAARRSRGARGPARGDGPALPRRRAPAAQLGRLPGETRGRSSSGRGAATGCTTASASPPHRTAGGSNGSRPSRVTSGTRR